MIIDTEGIILRQTKTLGGRRMILLFSEKYGKISAGTGIKEKSKGKTGLALHPFTYGRYELFKNRDRYHINRAEVIKSYYKIGENVDNYISSAYVLELTEKLLAEEQPSIEMFRLLVDFFDVMEKRKRDFITPVLAYQMKLLNQLGVTPTLDVCLICDCKVGEAPVFFSISDGGVICGKCRDKSTIQEKDTLIYPTDFGIVDILKYFSICSFRELERLTLEEKKQKAAQTIIRKYMAYYLDIKELKSEALFMKEQ